MWNISAGLNFYYVVLVRNRFYGINRLFIYCSSPLIVTSVLHRLMAQGWMGPELAAMDKVMGHSSDLYIHEFTLKNSFLLKNAIEDIEKCDEKYLLQKYRQ